MRHRCRSEMKNMYVPKHLDYKRKSKGRSKHITKRCTTLDDIGQVLVCDLGGHRLERCTRGSYRDPKADSCAIGSNMAGMLKELGNRTR